MEKFIITVDDEIDIEAKGTDLILQDIANIMRTFIGENAQNRDLGIDSSIIDQPINEIEVELKNILKSQITTYVPIAAVKSISISTKEGKIYPVVEVLI